METRHTHQSRMKTHHELLHSRDFQCCCCFHVRTGTIALGLFHVMMQMAIVAVIVTALFNPDILDQPKSMADLDNDIHRNSIQHLSSVVKDNYRDLNYALVLSTFFGFIAVLLMYGAIWGHPSYLMPFFGVMCFDFAASMLRLIGSFSERATVPHNVPAESGFVYMFAVILKAYLLNMVWSCYKFLRLRLELIRNPPATFAAHTVQSQPMATANRNVTTMEARLLLPDYETSPKFPYDFYPSPPPPYATATLMPTVEAAIAPPPSYQDVAGTSADVIAPVNRITTTNTTAAATVNIEADPVAPVGAAATVQATEVVAAPSVTQETVEVTSPALPQVDESPSTGPRVQATEEKPSDVTSKLSADKENVQSENKNTPPSS